MYGVTSSPDVLNSTIVENSAPVGGGIANNGESVPQITSSLFWGNNDLGGIDESAQIDSGGATALPVIRYSCVQGWTGTYGGTGNFGSSPDLASDGVHLNAGSSSVDTGDPALDPALAGLDLDGEARIYNARVDVGADELHP
jgi:hypothetical protein